MNRHYAHHKHVRLFNAYGGGSFLKKYNISSNITNNEQNIKKWLT